MLTIDIELTNRCNARCTFCPRDAMPQQGNMQPEVFEQSLARAIELRELTRQLPTPREPTVVFCGTGEPLLNRHAADYVRRVRESGFSCQVSTNGALLWPETTAALLAAGLSWINVNVSDIGEDYDRVYAMPFARTRDNLVRFIRIARGRCVVCIVVVDHRRDPAHLRAMEEYWRSLGADCVVPFGLVNRAGSLTIAEAALPIPPPSVPTSRPERVGRPHPICSAPFLHLFVGYDGRYYLCSSDWQKELSFGNVFETSFAAIMRQKLAHVASGERICQRCTLDPSNLLLRSRQVRDATQSRPLDASQAEILEMDRTARAFAADVLAAATDGTDPAPLNG